VAAKLIEVGPEGRQRIDRYELVAEIASGGMATVFLARLGGVGGFQRFVAIKRLHPHLAGEEEFVEMFLDEARLAAGIHHPNVVPILEVGASERGYYIVMEYIEGDTLARLLARAATSGRAMPAPVGLRIVLDMLAGLHAAHELRDHQGNPTELVHRDVSPQNVLVGMDGIARITDFGVARAASRLSATRVGQLKGKIAYMAPEQASATPVVDRRADIFSAGIVLWEVLAARRLFKAENDAATLSRIMSEPIPHLRQLNHAISPHVSDVVMKALERDPARRYPTCAKFADALERAANASMSIASGRELGAHVSEVFGDEIAAHRDAVRAWIARSEPSEARRRSMAGGFGSTVSAGAMALPGAAALPTGDVTGNTGQHPRSRKSLIGVLIALLLVGGAGAAALYIMKPRPTAVGPASTAAAPPVAAARPSVEPSGTATATAADPAASGDPAATPPRSRATKKPAPGASKPPDNGEPTEPETGDADPTAAAPDDRSAPAAPRPGGRKKRPRSEADVANPYR
jgi:serine/threonine-protein kinase